MAQKTFVDGDVLPASDINTYLMGEGGAWTSYTPTVTQSGAVTVTNTRSRYARYGRTIIVSVRLAVTGSGTAGNAITVTLPVTAASTDGVAPGSGLVFDFSGSAEHKGLPYLASTTTFAMSPTASTATGAIGQTGFTAALAANDVIVAGFIYEAAS
jgi:hypothetical protein